MINFQQSQRCRRCGAPEGRRREIHRRRDPSDRSHEGGCRAPVEVARHHAVAAQHRETAGGGIAEIKDRLSYAFALVSIAAALEREDDRIRAARLVPEGAAREPWRTRRSNDLRSRAADWAAFTQAAEELLRDAKGYGRNSFKVDAA